MTRNSVTLTIGQTKPCCIEDFWVATTRRLFTNVRFAPEAVGSEYFLGRARLLSRYRSYARDRATRWAAWRRDILCLYVLSTAADDLRTRDC